MHMPVQRLLPLQPELLGRLDDSSNRVRIAAAAALRPWLHAVLAEPGALPVADASGLANSLLIHLQDPDKEVAAAVAPVLEHLALARPSVRPLVEAVAGQPQQHSWLAGILAGCTTAPDSTAQKV